MTKYICVVTLAIASFGCSKSVPGPNEAKGEASKTSSEQDRPIELAIQVVTSPAQAGAVNSTLLHGPNDLVIVDAQFTKSGAIAVADAAAGMGKRVSRVFITHAHPDHYLGTAVLKERFPDAKFLATADVVEEMKKSAEETAKARKAMLGPEFPGMPVMPDVHPGKTLDIEGVQVSIMNGLAGDTHPITALYISSQGTLLASDIAYVDVHLWTADTDHEGRMAWAAQLGELEKLSGLERVVPGHQLKSSSQDPALLAYTRNYIRAFDAAASKAKSSEDLISAMKAQFPDAQAELFLQIGAKAAQGGGH